MAYCHYSARVKLRGGDGIDRAEEWIRANVRGLWQLEFIGMSEELHEATGLWEKVVHVVFRFGREEDLQRFRNEYLLGGRPTRAKTPARAKMKRKKGLVEALFG